MDAISSLISLLKPQAALLGRLAASGGWGITMPLQEHPTFFLVTGGECWLQPDGLETVHLLAGDFYLLLHPASVAFTSEPGAETVLADAAFKAAYEGEIRLGEEKASTRILGGLFVCSPINIDILQFLLPPGILIRSSEGAARIQNLIALIDEEYGASRPGREMAIVRLLELMLIEALRSYPRPRVSDEKGLVSGLCHPKISIALRHIHGQVERQWSVEELARLSGMSRASFAMHFADQVGLSPIEYLSKWRMAVAKDALISSDKTVSEIAASVGFQSQSAFSTAFSRIVGCSPTEFVTRSHREETRAQAV